MKKYNNSYPMGRFSTAARLHIILPKNIWLGEISRKYPNYQFEIKSSMPIEKEYMINNNLLTIKGILPNQVVESLKSMPALIFCNIVEEKPTEITIMIQTKGHYIIHALTKYQIIPQFPIMIVNGIVELRIIGTHDHIDKFIEELTINRLEVNIKSIGPFIKEDKLSELTPRQLYIYQKARESGYYESPRKITLTELAEKENVSKSTLSSTLQRIHKKLLGNPD